MISFISSFVLYIILETFNLERHSQRNTAILVCVCVYVCRIFDGKTNRYNNILFSIIAKNSNISNHAMDLQKKKKKKKKNSPK